MSQSWTDDVFSIDHDGPTDLQNMENNFAALKSAFSGASAPSNAVAGQPWYHTSKGLRIRNAGNSSWLKVLQGDANTQMWMMRNDTVEGWLINSSVGDRVLALKGGSLAYNVTGGSTAGSWTVSGLSSAAGHTHGFSIPHTHAPGTPTSSPSVWGFRLGYGDNGADPIYVSQETDSISGTETTDSSGGHTHTQDSSWRPSAAVGTLQYPDLG